jgi:hypothetical protein
MRPGLPGGSRLLTRGSLIVAVVLSLTQCGREAPAPTIPTVGGAVSVAVPLVNPSADPVIAAAGDLVCGSTTPTTRPCQHAAVAALVPTLAPDAVLLLGDIQYEDGTLADFNARFHPVWGPHTSIIYPVPGNHEYRTTNAAGYFDYFNGVGQQTGRAGSRSKGYYSFNLGAWHIVVLNSNCNKVGGCTAGSPMEQWLRADLAANPAMCTLAAWHHPRFSSGNHGSIAHMQPIWQALYDFDAEVVLSGHDHDYERFAPQTATGARDNARGMLQFVVGTGGKEHGIMRATKPNSLVRDSTSFGLLKLTLHPTSLDWQFVPIPGAALTDAGSLTCHGGAPPPPPPPPSPITITAPAIADAYVASGSPTMNRGAFTRVVVDSTPVSRTFLRFTVSGVGSRTITSAKLRLYVTDPSSFGGNVHVVPDNAWGEMTITFANAPAYPTATVGSIGAVTTGSWREVDVTSTIGGDGTFSFVLDSPALDAVHYASREAGATTAPRLVITAQ